MGSDLYNSNPSFRARKPTCRWHVDFFVLTQVFSYPFADYTKEGFELLKSGEAATFMGTNRPPSAPGGCFVGKGAAQPRLYKEGFELLKSGEAATFMGTNRPPSAPDSYVEGKRLKTQMKVVY